MGGTFYWIIEPIKNLKYRGQFNTGYSGSNYRQVGLPYSASKTSESGSYTLSQSQSQSSSFTMDNTLSYVLPQIGKNTIDVLVGQSFERSNWSTGLNMSFETTEENLNTLVLNGWDYNIPANYETVSGHGGYDNPQEGSIASFFARANWNYDEKYMATAIIRADASNNFARGKRWGYFPSFSAGWVITNEKFMESTRSWMDFFKIRASWGQNGNCNIGNFWYLSNIKFSPTDYADYGYKFSSDMNNTVERWKYQTGAYAYNVPNPDVTWETSEQINIGFDARFISGKLGVNFDWYKKTTKDWLVRVPTNQVSGYEEYPMMNAGDVENTGFELALSWRDKIGSDFNYHANVNIATNKNEVTRLANNAGFINGQDKALFENSSWASRVEVGHPIGYFSGMSYSGIWQNQAQIDEARKNGKAVIDGAVPGDCIWDDWNGDGQISLSEDRHEIGNPHPDVNLGASLGFEWKGLDFAVTGSGAFGMQVMQCYRTALLANPYNNYTVDDFDRWHGEGTNNSKPRLTVGSVNDQWVSTRYMQDADYFKIQNVTLGYDVARIWKNDLFSKLRVYVQAQNLYTFTGYTGVDPEIGSSGGKDSWARGIDVGLYPTARTFIVGASINFKGKAEKKATAAPAAPVIQLDNSQIDRLNAEIARLQAENDQLRNQKPEKEVVVEKDIVTFPYLVNFIVNTTDVVNREKVNLETVAKMIKATPEKKYNVVGYADMQTGTAEGNAQLAQGRAQNVYDILINQFGVSPSQLVKDSKGGVDYMYFNDEQLSRSVIISEVK